MRTIILAAAAVGGLLFTFPAQAGYGPLGNWQCFVDGAPAGTLLVEPTRYDFTGIGSAKAEPGVLIITQGVVNVLSGPLKALGAGTGHYSVVPEQAPYLAVGDWASQLEFRLGPAQALSCNPDYGDDSML